MCKCQYLSDKFAKKSNWHKNGRKTQDQEESANML